VSRPACGGAAGWRRALVFAIEPPTSALPGDQPSRGSHLAWLEWAAAVLPWEPTKLWWANLGKRRKPGIAGSSVAGTFRDRGSARCFAAGCGLPNGTWWWANDQQRLWNLERLAGASKPEARPGARRRPCPGSRCCQMEGIAMPQWLAQGTAHARAWDGHKASSRPPASPTVGGWGRSSCADAGIAPAGRNLEPSELPFEMTLPDSGARERPAGGRRPVAPAAARACLELELASRALEPRGRPPCTSGRQAPPQF